MCIWESVSPSIAKSAVIAPVMSFSLFSANSPCREYEQLTV